VFSLKCSKSKFSQNTTNLLSIVKVATRFHSESKHAATFTIDNKLVVFWLTLLLEYLRTVAVQPRLELVASQIQTRSKTASVHLLGDKHMRTYQWNEFSTKHWSLLYFHHSHPHNKAAYLQKEKQWQTSQYHNNLCMQPNGEQISADNQYSLG